MAKRPEIVVTRKIVPDPAQAEPEKSQKADIRLDAGAGKPLKNLLTELGAEVDWASNSLADRVVKGSYSGPRELVAQELLKDLSFAIYHDQARLRVVVLQLGKNVEISQNDAKPARRPCETSH